MKTKIGWLLLPEKWIALDKQFHGSWGIWITFAVFFLSLGIFESEYSLQMDIIRALVGILITFLVGLGIELYQENTGNGKYDINDATIMPIAGGVAIIFIIIIRTITIA